MRSFRTGQPELLNAGAARTIRALLRHGPARELLDALAPEHVAVFPLLGRNGAVGLLTLYTGAIRSPFGATDLAAAADIATRAGLVLDNGRLYRQQHPWPRHSSGLC